MRKKVDADFLLRFSIFINAKKVSVHVKIFLTIGGGGGGSKGFKCQDVTVVVLLKIE